MPSEFLVTVGTSAVQVPAVCATDRYFAWPAEATSSVVLPVSLRPVGLQDWPLILPSLRSDWALAETVYSTSVTKVAPAARVTLLPGM